MDRSHRLLLQFAHNNAFIYFLEAWAATIAPVLFQPLLMPQYVKLCENEAAKLAIIKGTGKHQPINNLIGSHWAWRNRRQVSTQLGWQLLEPPHRAILKRIFQILGATSVAHETGFDHVTDIETCHRLLL